MEQPAPLSCQETLHNYAKDLDPGDERSGIHQYRDEAGSCKLVLDHDTRTILFRKEDNAVGYVRRQGRWKPSVLKYLPAYPGSPVDMDSRFASTIVYPREAFDAKVTGEVIATAVITRQGTLTDLSIIQDPGFGLGQAVEVAISQISEQWIPASDGMSSIESMVYFSVAFTLDPLPDFVSPAHTAIQTTGMGRFNQSPALTYFRSYTVNRAPEERTELSRT